MRTQPKQKKICNIKAILYFDIQVNKITNEREPNSLFVPI